MNYIDEFTGLWIGCVPSRVNASYTWFTQALEGLQVFE